MELLYNKCYLNSNDLGVIFSEFGLSGISFLSLLIFGRAGTLLMGGVY